MAVARAVVINLARRGSPLLPLGEVDRRLPHDLCGDAVITSQMGRGQRERMIEPLLPAKRLERVVRRGSRQLYIRMYV